MEKVLRFAGVMGMKKSIQLTLFIAGLALLLLATPTAQASAPVQGSGDWASSRVFTSAPQITDDGNTKITLIATGTFTGDIEGALVAPITIIVHDDGTFNIVGHEGTFTGSVHGRSGTAKMSVASTSGIGPNSDLCCLTGTIQIKGIGGDLKGFSSRIEISNQPEGKTYTSKSHFK